MVVDYHSKWVELFLLRTSMIASILTRETFTRCGTPAYLISD